MRPVREISKAYFSGLFAIFAPNCLLFGANRKSSIENWQLEIADVWG
jgi:hypothetical protein